jgi:uncharacterized protein YbcI
MNLPLFPQTATARIEQLDQPQSTVGQKIAWAIRAFEKRRTKHGRKWVVVFMNEDTIVMALHGSLTDAEKALTQTPAGTSQVRAFHRNLFADVDATLLQKIKSITGMQVRHTTGEMDPTTGSVVQVFATDTVGEAFLACSQPIGLDPGTGKRCAPPAPR